MERIFFKSEHGSQVQMSNACHIWEVIHQVKAVKVVFWSFWSSVIMVFVSFNLKRNTKITTILFLKE